MNMYQTFLEYSTNDFTSNDWYNFIILDVLSNEKKIICIRQLGVFADMRKNAIISYLINHHSESKKENLTKVCPLCTKRSKSCYSFVFEVSGSELLVILKFMGIKLDENAVKRVSAQEKISINSPDFFFADSTGGGCKIFEIKMFSCRKYAENED